MAERALAIDLVRGWGLEFDGTGDPKQFLGRIEEKAATFGIRLDHIAGAMKFLLKGNALHWWQACPIQMTDWIIFKTQLNFQFVADKRTGRSPYKRSLAWKERTRKRTCYTSQQSGDGGAQEQGVLNLYPEDSWEEDLRVLLTNPNEETTDIPLVIQEAGHKRYNDTPSEESWEEDPAVPLTNPNEETTEIPLIIKEEAWVRKAQKRPGKQVCFKRNVEGKDYRIKISRSGNISICRLKPDQLTDDQREQPPIYGAQILTDGGTRLQEDHIEFQPKESFEENDATPLENPSEETTEIPEVIQAEACWRQAQRRPGQQVCYNMSVDGKDYRIEISHSGNLRICQLQHDQCSDNQTELPPINGPQFHTDCGSQHLADVTDLQPEKYWEEDNGVPLNDQNGETTDIPLVIQEEARLRAQKRGKKISFKRSVDGKIYRVKINRGGYIDVCQMKPDQLRNDQCEWVRLNGPQLLTDCGTQHQGDFMHLEPEKSWEEDEGVPPTNDSEETTDIPLIIQEEARQRAQKRGKKISFKRSVDGKIYRVKINRGGYIDVCQMKPDQLRDDQCEWVRMN